MSKTESTTIDFTDAYTLRVLQPADVRLVRSSPNDARVRLTIRDERSYISVTVSRAFPFSKPTEYVGFQDGAGADIGIMPSIEGIDDESQAIIDEEMHRRYFTPCVTKVFLVTEMQGTVTWEVDTNRGHRRFVVRNIRDNAYSLGQGRIMLTDSEGNRYFFPDIMNLGRRAYEVLSKIM
jgi:hypothetical protein